jgi:putative exporter of polyketide antibiotics
VSAVTIMLIAFGALILAHWANNQPTISQTALIEMIFAVLFIAFLEGVPGAAPIAQGLAWIFLAATLLGNDSILTGLTKATGTTGKAA